MMSFERSPLIAARGVLLRSATFTVAVLAVAAGSAASAWSQTPPGQTEGPPVGQLDASPIETVTISAQKRGVLEDAQTVPIALTAINGVEIEERHVRNLQDLTVAAPNVTLTDAGTVPGFANFTIRGLGINSTIPSIEPAVGVFVDGIYQGVSAAAFLTCLTLRMSRSSAARRDSYSAATRPEAPS
jgi:iron complex outermembrane receptor protein